MRRLNVIVWIVILCVPLHIGTPLAAATKQKVKSGTNYGLSHSIPNVIGKKGNKAKFDWKLTKKLGKLMQSYSSGSMNNFNKKSQQYCLSRKHFVFLNGVSEKWVKGEYSKKKALRLASDTKFTMWDASEEPAWSLVEGTVQVYEVKSRNEDEILKHIGKTNHSSFAYVYVKCFYDKKTRSTTVYLVNGRIF